VRSERAVIAIVIFICVFCFGHPAWAQIELPVSACLESKVFSRGTDPVSLPPPALPYAGVIQANIPKSAESKLQAYIYDKGTILAPRGWHCEYNIDSGYGYDVRINPTGDHSNRYGLIESFTFRNGYIAASEMISEWADTYFPKVIERLSPNTVIKIDNGHNWTQDGAYAFPRYKTDQLRYKSELEVEFTTPAHRLGVGSSFFENPNSANSQPASLNFPVSGFMSLSTTPDFGGEPGLCHLVIYVLALPADMLSLKRYLIKDAESRSDATPNQKSTAC